MAYKLINDKHFDIGNGLQIYCRCEDTRYGFRHTAELRGAGFYPRITAKACYYNRTWERYEFESVILSIATKAGGEIEAAIRAWNDAHDPLEGSGFGAIGLVAAMGSLLTDNQAEANDWKLRMIKAGLGELGLRVPPDWGTLSEDEKERRLDAVIAELRK